MQKLKEGRSGTPVCARQEGDNTTDIVLTPRELDVLGWFSLGKSTWEIAHILSCTEATVNFHFCNIRRKFDVSSRTAALVKALRLGIVNRE
ncbi:response regulator transcription factor [Pseudomonas sp. R5(2019)]|uniref:response regulator transcription factor n=1 Tax=Pseudomonas sp. R5(2019) TaxID=2697566 RepID=UPI00141265B4|nr:LuxR family transcriptional regulator [Pseudomonas sp. R5(2019)]NBA94746.1 helix-turn-helix transcriptional regulator [Pseudomonas sp. R5(2019)]